MTEVEEFLLEIFASPKGKTKRWREKEGLSVTSSTITRAPPKPTQIEQIEAE